MKLTTDIVTEKAKTIGFDLVGFAKADELVSSTNSSAFAKPTSSRMATRRVWHIWKETEIKEKMFP